MLSVMLLLNLLAAVPALHEFWHAADRAVSCDSARGTQGAHAGGVHEHGHAHGHSHGHENEPAGVPGGCDQPDCVVVAFAHGKLEVGGSVIPATRPETVSFPAPAVPFGLPPVREAWDSPLGRGPPSIA